MADFPNSLDTFVQHADNVHETIAAAHANKIQDAVVAIEQELGTATGSHGSIRDRLTALEAAVSAAAANGAAIPVASTSARGIVRLAGDLSGTADNPRVSALSNLATISYADAPRKVKALGNVSGAVTLDLTQANYFSCTAVGDVVFTVVGWDTKVFFQHAMVKVAQDTTGSRNITWPSRFSSNSTVSGLSTAANSYVLFEFGSLDIGSNVSLWAQPAFSVPVQADRYDAAVLNLANLLYFWPTEELSGTTATDVSAATTNGSYSGTFSFNTAPTVPTSTKKSPTFVVANSNFIDGDGTERAASTSAWSLGFTIKTSDPGTSTRWTVYSETLSTDSTTNQGFFIESGTTTIQSAKTAMNMRLTNNSGVNIFNKVLSSYYFDTLAHDVVVSFDGTNTYKVYFDGALADTVTQAPTAATVDHATWGARRRNTTDRYFAGGLGRLWTRSTVTVSSEVTALHSAFSTGGSTGGGSGGGTTVPPATTFDQNGVKLGVPSIVVNNSQITGSAVIDRNQTVAFQYLQIAVRPPAGSGGTAFSMAYTPGTQTGSGTQTITDVGTCDVNGTWTAFATYSLVANPVQADWIDGTPTSFTIGTVAPPDPGGGGGTTPGTMLLGTASGHTANGGDDSWIGKAVDIAARWDDSDVSGQINTPGIQPGGEYGSWNRYLDYAIGGIFSGDTWSQAAAGAYDSRWRQCLTNIKTYWGSRDPSKLFIRFAHEFNGDWFWPVHGADAGNFVTAWRRFRALQKEIMPLAKLVWCANDGTTGSLGLQLLDAWPGSSYVDIYGIDFYNQYPHLDGTSQSAFDNFMNNGMGTRTPVGPEAHRKQAEAFGLPIGFGEWGNTAIDQGGSGGGDAPAWINKVFDWFFLHQGTGAGQIMYGVYFNIGQFAVNPVAGGATGTAAAFKTRMLNRV